MSLRRREPRVSLADYLAGERDSPIRHEYVDGHVYAMAGASDWHNRIALNIASWLNDNLRENPCETFISDMKVRVAENTFYYPDVMVSCDPPGADPYYRVRPVLTVEVTSPTTERTDHHEKLLAYRQIESLSECVLVSQDQMRVEVHRRSGSGWKSEMLPADGDAVTFSSIGLSISLEAIYRNVRLDAV